MSEHATGRLLVVDDDDGVRRSLRRQLVRAGWTVEDFSDPIQSLARLQHGAAPAALITDVIMPRMNGRQLATEMAKHVPEIKVLYMSGYTENAIVHHGRLDADATLLQKPFRRASLAQSVRRMLDG